MCFCEIEIGVPEEGSSQIIKFQHVIPCPLNIWLIKCLQLCLCEALRILRFGSFQYVVEERVAAITELKTLDAVVSFLLLHFSMSIWVRLVPCFAFFNPARAYF